MSLVVTFEYHAAGNEIAKEEIPVAVNGYIEAFTQKFCFLYDFAGGAVAGQVEAEQVNGFVFGVEGAELRADFFGIGGVNDAVGEVNWHGFGGLLEQSRKKLSAQGGVGQYNEFFEFGLQGGNELQGGTVVEVFANAFIAGAVYGVVGYVADTAEGYGDLAPDVVAVLERKFKGMVVAAKQGVDFDAVVFFAVVLNIGLKVAGQVKAFGVHELDGDAVAGIVAKFVDDGLGDVAGPLKGGVVGVEYNDVDDFIGRLFGPQLGQK